MHLSNMMLDVLGTAPVEAVIIYTWSRVLHMRNRAAFYLLMSSCMLVVVLTRGDAGAGIRFAYLVFTGGVLPFLMADERPARKVFVIALMNVAIMIAEVLGTALWYGMTGIGIIDYDNTRAHLGEFVIMHATHLVLLIALFAALLQGQLDACLAQCNAFVLEVEQTAKMRHDVRNQAHAAMVLAERGDYARARDHISSFRSLYLSK